MALEDGQVPLYKLTIYLFRSHPKKGSPWTDFTPYKLDVLLDGDLWDLRHQLAEKCRLEEDHLQLYRLRSKIELSALNNRLKEQGPLEFAEFRDYDDKIRSFIGLAGDAILPPRWTFFALYIAQTRAVTPNTVEEDTGGLILSFEKLLSCIQEAPSPSKCAKSTEYRKYQAGPFPLCDGRFCSTSVGDTAAPPIELYHPIFAYFRSLVESSTQDVPEDVLRGTAELMRSLSQIQVQEHPQDKDTRSLLGDVLGCAFVCSVNLDKSAVDYVAQEEVLSECAGIAFCEMKAELGTGGSDPSVQVSFSYGKYWVCAERTNLRNQCCCPSFLIGLAGPWLIVLGAVTTNRIIVQRLTPYMWLACSRSLDDQIMTIARTLYALKLSFRNLREYYKTLKPVTLPVEPVLSRFYPSITSYKDPLTNQEVQFQYIKPLEPGPTCVTFLITRDSMEPKEKVVVLKFVTHYGVEVHKYMATHLLAPTLIYHGPIGDGTGYGDLKMVVMEYVRGKTLFDEYGDSQLPEEAQEGVRTALMTLHDGGFVYGDLRRPNIMLTAEDVRPRIRFIDFDWSGKQGDVRYPPHLSSAVRSVSGASDYAFIQRTHEDNMLKQL